MRNREGRRRLLDRAATMISYEAYVKGSTDNICTMVISLLDNDCFVCFELSGFTLTGFPPFGSFILVRRSLSNSVIEANSISMFSRALSQSARMTSRAMRNSSLKTVVKRHSHDHAGTPQPPYVQRNAPTKSV